MLGLFGPSHVCNLDTTLLHLSRRDRWTLRDALEGGVLISGGTGAGKTSGSGQATATAALLAGCGALVLCAKEDEAARWWRYCKATGRTRSFIRFDGSGTRRFNFLDYAMATQPSDGLIHNVVTLLLTILDGAEGKIGGDTGDQAFWRASSSELLSNTIAALWAAYGRITLAEVVEFIQSRPTRPEQVTEAAFRETFWARTMHKARTAPMHSLPEAEFRRIFNYFVHVLAQPDQRTSGNIVATISARLHPFLTGKLHELFCTTTNTVPELTHEGAVLVIDLPVEEYGEAGVLGAQIWKYLWQQACRRRKVNRRTRPVFVWADECQFFLSPHDAQFVSTSRSKRAFSVYLTQNLPTFYARIQDRNPQDVTDSLIGNFGTKIFHAQSDPRTNQWAADLIGKGIQLRNTQGGSANTSWSKSVGSGTNSGSNSGESFGGLHGSSSAGSSRGRSDNRSSGRSGGEGESWSAQEQMDYVIQPAFFTTLRKSGGMVDALLFQGGRRFRHSGATWLPVSFRQ